MSLQKKKSNDNRAARQKGSRACVSSVLLALVRWLRSLRCASFGSFRPCLPCRRRAHLNLDGTAPLLNSTTCEVAIQGCRRRRRRRRTCVLGSVDTHRVARFARDQTIPNHSKASKQALIPYCPRAGNCPRTETRRRQSISPGAESIEGGAEEQRSGNKWRKTRSGTL